MELWTSSTPYAGSLRVHGSLPNQSMGFVDLEKAFDCVPLGVLWGVLREYGVSDPLTPFFKSAKYLFIHLFLNLKLYIAVMICLFGLKKH